MSKFQLGSPKKKKERERERQTDRGGEDSKSEKKKVTNHTTEIQRILRLLWTIKHKLEYLEEIDKILETHNLSTLNNGETEILNRLVTS